MIAALLLRFWPYIAIAALSAGLYWSIESKGKLSSQVGQLNSVIAGNIETIDNLRNTQQLSEFVLVAHAGKQEVIRDEVEVIRYRNREIIKQVPAGDCRVTAHPDDVAGLLNSAGQD